MKCPRCGHEMTLDTAFLAKGLELDEAKLADWLDDEV